MILTMVTSDVMVGCAIGTYYGQILSRVNVLLVVSIVMVETRIRFVVGQRAHPRVTRNLVFLEGAQLFNNLNSAERDVGYLSEPMLCSFFRNAFRS